MMNLKEIVDKIPAEADVNPAEYPVNARIDDINEYYLELVEWATQIASREPMSGSETTSEEITLLSNKNDYTRTILDVPIFNVEFQADGSTNWCSVDEDEGRRVDPQCECGITYHADEKRIFVSRYRKGKIRVTYANGAVTKFSHGDYSASPIPKPVWLPDTFVPLLYLRPALTQAEYYKTDRVEGLRRRLERLEGLFYNHYSRNSTRNPSFSTLLGNNR